MAAKIQKATRKSKANIHFAVERGLYLMFLSAVCILEYKAVAAFFREKIVLAIEEAEEKTGQVLLKKNILAFLKQTNRRRLTFRVQRISDSSIVQVHIYIDKEILSVFLLAIQKLGYGTQTEFFREKMRLAIDDAGRIMGFSLFDKDFSDEA